MLVSSSAADVKVYNLAAGGGGSLFDVLPRRKRKRRRRGGNTATTVADTTANAGAIMLLQEFEFVTTSQCLKISPDCRYVAATGIYPPEVRIFDVEELGLKFKRGLDYEVVDFLFLGEDYKKLFFLQVQRHIDIHAQGGTYYKMCVGSSTGMCLVYDVRSPRPMYYHMHYNFESIKHVEWKTTAISAIAGRNSSSSGSSGQTIDDDDSAAAALHLLEEQSLAGRGTADNCFSASSNSHIYSSNTSSNNVSDTGSSSYAWRPSTTSWGVGGGGGEALVASGDAVSIHVWRCSSDHHNHHTNSCTGASVAGWYTPQQQQVFAERNNTTHTTFRGAAPTAAHVVAHIEAADALPEDEGPTGGGGANKRTDAIQQHNIARFNTFTFYPGSGLCFTACERKRMGVYFLPSLGIAPRWCSFLDSITEELEEASVGAALGSSSSSSSSSAAAASAQYDDYKFVTRQQLEQLGVQELIGTALVKRYMHGYFMDAKLYRKLKETLQPFDYDAYRRERVQQKLQEKRKMRIEIRSKVPKTNIALARRLEETVTGAAPRNKKEKRQQEAARQLLTDDRFEKLFTNPDFEIEADYHQ